MKISFAFSITYLFYVKKFYHVIVHDLVSVRTGVGSGRVRGKGRGRGRVRGLQFLTVACKGLIYFSASCTRSRVKFL